MISEFINKKIPVAIEILQQHEVRSAYLFGSVCTENFNKDSDIDILIAFNENLNPLRRGALHLQLFEKLENLFNRKVDILTIDYLKNPYLIKSIEKTKMPLYE